MAVTTIPYGDRTTNHRPTQPSIYCPVSSSINRHVETIHHRTLQWACDFNLVLPGTPDYQRLEAAKFAWLVARVYPRAGYTELQIISDWVTWIFIHDDLCDVSAIGKRPQRLRHIHNMMLWVLEGGSLTAENQRLASALYDIRQRLWWQTDAQWLRRFTDHMDQYFQANRWEASNREASRTPSLEAYTEMRPFTSGLEPCIDLMLMAAQLSAASAFLKHRVVHSLTLRANRFISWTNDIYGLDKEIQEGNMNNLVLVLQHEYQLSAQAAIHLAVEMCNTEMEAFLSLESNLPSFGEAEDIKLNTYLAGLRSWMRGTLDWYLESGRYDVETGVRLSVPARVETHALCA